MTRPMYRYNESWVVGNLEQSADTEIVTEVSSGGTPSTEDLKNWGGTIQWLTPKEVTNGRTFRYVTETQRTITTKGLDESAAKVLPPRTVMLTKRAPVGEVVINNAPMATNQGFLNFRCGKQLLPDFLYYWFKANRPYLDAVANGSTYAELYPSDAFEFQIGVPSVGEQRSIVGILGSLDDKIETNRQTNLTLEAIAQSVFESWFVDFDPVHAKVEGRESIGSGRATGSLFPESLVDSPLGKIPRGWKTGVLGDLADIVMGQSPPGTTYNENGDGLPFYQGIRDFGFRFPSRRVYCKALHARNAKKGDILLSVRAPVGSLNVAIEQCVVGRGIAALHSRTHHNGFLYYLLRATRSGWEKFDAEGTVFGSVSKDDVRGFPIVVPSLEAINQFNLEMGPIDQLIESNEHQSRILIEIRDILLPKLISGEVRVENQLLVANKATV